MEDAVLWSNFYSFLKQRLEKEETNADETHFFIRLLLLYHVPKRPRDALMHIKRSVKNNSV